MIQLIILIPILLLTWIALFPHDVLSLVLDLKHLLRHHILLRAGQQGMEELAWRLHAWAAQNNIDSDLVGEAIEENEQEIVKQLGTKKANALLGYPTPLE